MKYTLRAETGIRFALLKDTALSQLAPPSTSLAIPPSVRLKRSCRSCETNASLISLFSEPNMALWLRGWRKTGSKLPFPHHRCSYVGGEVPFTIFKQSVTVFPEQASQTSMDSGKPRDTSPPVLTGLCSQLS